MRLCTHLFSSASYATSRTTLVVARTDDSLWLTGTYPIMAVVRTALVVARTGDSCRLTGTYLIKAVVRATLAVARTGDSIGMTTRCLCSTQADKTERTPHGTCKDSLERLPTRCTTSQILGQFVKMV